MNFYETLAKNDVGVSIKNVIVKQNELLKILQEEPNYKNYDTGYY